MSGAPLAVASEEKQRVPKPVPRTKQKPASDAKASSSDEDDDSGCLGSCFSGLFESLFSGNQTPSPTPSVGSLSGGPRAWVVDDHGWLRAQVLGDSVVLWQGPAEPGREDAEVGRLPDGTEVVVMETHTMPTWLEVRVRPVDGVEPAGWISSRALSEVAPAPPVPEAPTPKPRPLAAATRWGLQVVAGGGGFGNSDLDAEYADGGLRLETHYVGFLPESWTWSAGVGYWNLRGNPLANYQNSTEIDDPRNSRFEMFDVGVQAGQRYGARSGFRFGWSLGPALYHVHETADIRSYFAGTMAFKGDRVERLDRWTGGGNARLITGWRFASRVELGLQVGGFVMAWKDERKKSLTSDYTSESIYGFDAALALTYPAP